MSQSGASLILQSNVDSNPRPWVLHNVPATYLNLVIFLDIEETSQAPWYTSALMLDFSEFSNVSTHFPSYSLCIG